MFASPKTPRAASMWGGLQRILQLSTVEGPPFPRGTTWSTSSRTVDPHTRPSASFHWHFPSSLFTTSRFTLAGTQAFRFACFSMSSSSAAVRISSSDAPGCTWDCPAFAFFRSARNAGDTVTCIRLSCDVSGSTTVRGAGATGRSTFARTDSVLTPIRLGSTVELARPRVTTVRTGTTSAGRISAATCFASWRDLSKNLGRTSARFSSVITRASSTTLDMQSRPSRRGSTASGNLSTSRVAVSL
jgi:hypothetical protein